MKKIFIYMAMFAMVFTAASCSKDSPEKPAQEDQETPDNKPSDKPDDKDEPSGPTTNPDPAPAEAVGYKLDLSEGSYDVWSQFSDVAYNADGSVTFTMGQGDADWKAGEFGFSVPDEMAAKNPKKFVVKYKDASAEKTLGAVCHYNSPNVSWVEGEKGNDNACDIKTGSDVKTIEFEPGDLANGLQTVRFYNLGLNNKITIVEVIAVIDGYTDPADDPSSVVPDGMFSVDLGIQHQTMQGFGGALCWMTHMLLDNPKKDEILDLIFDDLGMDILRVGMWYYPKNYPENKVSTWDDEDKYLLENTKTLVAKAKEYNPDIQILMSCWGPPAALKSNGQRERGMLKYGENSVYDKNDKDRIRAERQAAYSNYAQFFCDAFDNIGFMPDYLNIQNECSYAADWVTCKWSYNDTHTEPNYYSAFDSVYNRFKDKYGNKMPKMLACEAENLDVLEKFYPWKKIPATGTNPERLWGYSYHLYNFNDESDINYIKQRMQTLGTEMADRPNFMTEYDGMGWMKTARTIQYELIYANCSAYLYWNIFWYHIDNNIGSEIPCIVYTDNNSNYKVGPFYYLIKHFSKHIDAGYKRVEINDSADKGIEGSAFVSPDGNSVTVILVNPTTKALNYEIQVSGKEIAEMEAYQSRNSKRNSKCYEKIENLLPGGTINLPRESVTTIVLKLQ